MWWRAGLVVALMSGVCFVILNLDGSSKCLEYELVKKAQNILKLGAEVLQWNLFLPDFLLFWKSSPTGKNTKLVKLLTKAELKTYRYQYLSIVGEVFDVTSKEKLYGKDGHYNFFTGVMS